jgi:hypothetical protein
MSTDQPLHRWIYKQPHTWTEADYDADQAKPGELAYSHMAMLTHLPNGSLASLMQVRACHAPALNQMPEKMQPVRAGV